jgi:pimeloyl-ACP methyl ester carboxylesterase
MNPLLLALIPPVGALVVVFWILFSTAFTHLRWSHFYRRAGEEPPSLDPHGWPWFYFRTLRAAVTLIWWTFAHMFQNGLRCPAGELTGPPVLCVHGFHMTGSCMWGLRRLLEGRGRPTRSVFLGEPYRSAEVYAEALARAMRDLVREFESRGIDIVAHSMGGLITRKVLADDPELAVHVRRIVTLGSPHHGTGLLSWIRFGPVYQMMSLESKFIRELPDFRTSTPAATVTTVATKQDLVVYPLSTCFLPGSRTVTLNGLGHMGLLTEPEAFAVVTEALPPTP